MKIVPIMKKIIVACFLLYFNEVGINSDIAICNIIPAIVANKQPITISDINGFKNKNVIIAPSSSDKPDINVYNNALNLLPVA